MPPLKLNLDMSSLTEYKLTNSHFVSDNGRRISMETSFYMDCDGIYRSRTEFRLYRSKSEIEPWEICYNLNDAITAFNRMCKIQKVKLLNVIHNF